MDPRGLVLFQSPSNKGGPEELRSLRHAPLACRRRGAIREGAIARFQGPSTPVRARSTGLTAGHRAAKDTTERL
jgi:hypothetical protein